MLEFALENSDYIELHNLLKATGLCDSGGMAKMLIADGLVLVDDVMETRKRCKVRRGQTVEFDNQKILVC